jgi:YidC/Oxa1 family membrane protein insertase
MTEIFNTLIYLPLYNFLIILYNFLWNDLGLAIIALTLIIKIAFIPLSRKQITSQREMQKIQPEIKKLQAKYKDDKETQSKEMMKLYKKHKINPAAGCLPIIIQMVVFITMYKMLRTLSQVDSFNVTLDNLYNFVKAPTHLNEFFLGIMNLAEPNYFLAFLTAGLQYYQIKMMQENNKKDKDDTKEIKKIDDKTDGKLDFSTIMSKQMLIVIPLITLFVGLTFPSGLTLYWLTSTIFIIVQQWVVMNKKNKNKKETKKAQENNEKNKQKK